MSPRRPALFLAFLLLSACGGKVSEAITTSPDGGTITSPAEDAGVFVDATTSIPDGGITTPVESGIHPDSTIISPSDASFDVGIEPDDGGICTPESCEELGVACGLVGDGCGDALNCGPCVHDAGGCVPTTCAQAYVNCGVIGDGCGNVLSCGTCEDPLTCGGGGVPNVCGGLGVVDAGGSWLGTWDLSGQSSPTGQASFQIMQDGSALSGTVSFANEPCFGAATFTATLSGSTFSGTMTDGPNTGEITATIMGSSMSGAAKATAGGCVGFGGTFTVMRN